MMSIDEVASYVLSLDGVVEGQRHGHRTWFVGKKVVAWERPFSKADLKRFGAETPPDGDIVAVPVLDLGEKEAVLAEGHQGVFTIEHFDNYPAVLVQLRVVTKKTLRDLLTDAHRAAS